MNTYQPIYDATKAAFDGACLLNYIASASASVSEAAQEHARPSAVYRPAISIDGNQWCALYGLNLQDGVAGFGDSPEQAMRAFDAAWLNLSNQNE